MNNFSFDKSELKRKREEIISSLKNIVNVKRNKNTEGEKEAWNTFDNLKKRIRNMQKAYGVAGTIAMVATLGLGSPVHAKTSDSNSEFLKSQKGKLEEKVDNKNEYDFKSGDKSLRFPDQKSVEREILYDSKLNLDHKNIELAQPLVKENEEVLVPVKDILKQVGAKVSWNGETKTINIEKDGFDLQVKANKKQAYFNGNEIKLSATPQIVNSKDPGQSKFMMPVDSVLKNFGGLEAYYNKQSKEMVVTSDRNVEIQFKDENLEELIRKKIDKSNGVIYRNDVSSIKELDSENKDINSLRGIENLKNIEKLDLMYNNIEDLAPLTNRTDLEELKLNDNFVSNIKPLSNLRNLKGLYLDNNKVEDISALNSLTKLENLILGYNRIKDISVVSKLKNLKILFVDMNPILDYSSILNHPNRKDIYIGLNLEQKQKAVKEGDRIVDKLIKDGMTDLEKEKVLYDYIIKNTKYTTKNTKGAYGVLLEGRGKCADYAEALMILLNKAGIEALYVPGDVSFSSAGHAWNIVKIDGEYYHADPTWDDDSDINIHEYFNVSDKTMETKGERTWEEKRYPKCKNDLKQ